MKISDVIKSMDQAENTKTAAVAPSTTTDALKAALAKINAPEPKVAAAPATDDAVANLFKIATELSGAEKDAELNQAYLCGCAFADGAIAKFTAYDAVVKEAAARDATTFLQAEQMKVASASSVNVYAASQEAVREEQNIKLAAAQGYNDALALIQNNMQKEAQSGYEDALKQTHDTAVGEFLKGAAAAEILIERARQVR
jgi:hypothetical protein